MMHKAIRLCCDENIKLFYSQGCREYDAECSVLIKMNVSLQLCQIIKNMFGFYESCERFSIISIMPEIGPNLALHASPTYRNSTVLIFTVPVHSLYFCQSSSSMKCFASE